MLTKQIYLIICFLGFFCSYSQKPFKSVMQEEQEFYSAFNLTNDKQFDSLQFKLGNRSSVPQNANKTNTVPCVLTKKIFGWHPTWNGTTYLNYQWNLLSDLCYFDYTINPATGGNTNAAFAWNTASVVTMAINNGTKVHICATLFANHASFWASSTAQTAFINNIVALLNNRQGNGVNIDFEGMGASDKIPFTTFITNLNTALNVANPNYQLSICLYAVDWSGVFDIPALNNQVDFFTIMGYDYYYAGSAQAGPTSPLYNFQPSNNYTISKSITYYIKQGALASKLIMGLPYYGREWEVIGASVPANTTGAFNASRTLSFINNNQTTYASNVKFWEGNCYSPYYKFLSGSSNRQCFIDDYYSLGRKYDMVNQRGLGGIGIWALGYDDGMIAFWNLIQDRFSDCAPVVCQDSLFDMGGPTRNYYDNEKYTYVLNANVGQNVKLQFVSFGTEMAYDSLWLYNGNSIAAPLIGAYTGTNSPGTFTSTGQYLTLRFKSDAGTNTFGFKAYKSCVTTNTITTNISLQEAENYFVLYPNPSSDVVNIRSDEIIKDWKLTDIFGKVIEQDNTVNNTKVEIQTQNLSRGIYFVEVNGQSANVRPLKLIVQ